jgi:alpha-N-arabinofuranosidase
VAPKIPEFILRNMFVKGSFKLTESGFSFQIRDTYAPATVTGFRLEVNGQPVPLESIQLILEGGESNPAVNISPETPFALPVNVALDVIVQGTSGSEEGLRISVDTREAGTLSFTVKAGQKASQPTRYPKGKFWKQILAPVFTGQAVVHLDSVTGEIDPRVYGHFVEHLENCVYGGIFTLDGREMNADVVEWIEAMKPTIIRYPGGNFASDYHWEEGIGPRDQRPVHYDRAWHREDLNQVGTDEFMAFCEAVGAEPFLVINDGSGTPEEAARWVAYCNAPVDTEMGAKRAANGHPEPYGVKVWGLGNEVWGEWQVGHTDAAGYVQRIKPFITAMRAVDPEIELVAVGLDMLAGDPHHAEAWNRTVLEGIGDQVDHLSFHVYQPSEEGYQAEYDPEELYHNIISAPYSVEDAIRRMRLLIEEVVPNRKIGIALDEYNVKYPPRLEAHTMHEQAYALRDGLYIAGMLNMFHRQCRVLKIADLALLVNTLPAIVKPENGPAFPTALFFPFMLYSHMEKQVLEATTWSPDFAVKGLGLNISPRNNVPYLELTVTRSEDGRRLTLGIANRHPQRDAKVMVNLKGEGEPVYKSKEAWLMLGKDPLAVNTPAEPENIELYTTKPPVVRYGWLDFPLPKASLMVITLEQG